MLASRSSSLSVNLVVKLSKSRRDIFNAVNPCTAMYVAGMRDAVKAAVVEALLRPGRSIRDIRAVQCSEEELERRHGNNPVWHELTEMRAFVADRLALDKDRVLGSSRRNNDFGDAVLDMIGNLKRRGFVETWQKRSGVFCVVKDLSKMQTKPSMSTQKRETGRRPGQPTGDDALKERFVAMLDGHVDDTYKFALARALLDYCHSEGGKPAPELVIKYEYLAEKFLEYYWKLAWFGIKQNVRGAESRVLKTIRELFGEKTPERFDDAQQQYRTEIGKAKSSILTGVFGHARSRTSIVVHAFQNVPAGAHAIPDEVFYKPDDDDQCLKMYHEALSFMSRNYDVLRYNVLARWSLHLENLNPSMIKIMTKLSREKIKRSDLKKFHDMLTKYFDTCFYCGVRLGDGMEVDHFIPWSYVLEDNLWNMVLACRSCNRKKGNQLPDVRHLEKIYAQNSRLRSSSLEGEFAEYEDERLELLYGMCRASRRP